MSSRLERLVSGLKANPLDTLVRVVRYGYGSVNSFFADLLYYFFRAQAVLAPTRTLAKLKQGLNPTVKLDYSRHSIFMHADSELSLFRSRACQKEPETIVWIENFMKPGEVFYDVGANVGAYSLVASKFLDGRVRVYAFEPSFSTYDQLCRNILLNRCQDSVYPFMLALNESTGLVEFDYHSLEAGDAEHLLIDPIQGPQSESQSVYRQSLPGFRLDDLIAEFNFPRPTHIKLDVDGSELAVLRGAAETLKSDTLRSVLVEVRKQLGQAEWVENLLGEAGFKLISEHDRGNGVIWNYIFNKLVA